MTDEAVLCVQDLNVALPRYKSFKSTGVKATGMKLRTFTACLSIYEVLLQHLSVTEPYWWTKGENKYPPRSPAGAENVMKYAK